MKKAREGLRSVSMAALISLCVCGVFGPSPGSFTEGSNTAYISVPLAALVSGAAGAALFALFRSGGKTFPELLDPFGRAVGTALALPLALGLLFCAVRPLSVFIQVLHRLVFDGAVFALIQAFVLPVTFFMAAKGASSVGRTALVLAGVIGLSFAANTVLAAPGFDAYRLYAGLGEGAGQTLSSALSYSFFFMTPLLGIAVNAGEGDLRSLSHRSALVTGVKAAAVCFAAQISTALSFHPAMLGDMIMPLCRIAFVSPKPGAIYRFDKVFVMIWLMGAMISAAYCLASGARLVSGVLGAESDLPAALIFCALAAGLLFLPLALPAGLNERVRFIIERYGAALPAVTAAAAAVSAFRERRRKRA